MQTSVHQKDKGAHNMLVDLTDVVFMVEGGRIGKLRVSCWHRVDILCIGGSPSEIEEETQFYTL